MLLPQTFDPLPFLLPFLIVIYVFFLSLSFIVIIILPLFSSSLFPFLLFFFSLFFFSPLPPPPPPPLSLSLLSGMVHCDEDMASALQAQLALGEAQHFDLLVVPMREALSERVYERLLRLVRVGGVIAVLGSLAEVYAAYREEWDDRVLQDERVDVAVLPLAAGVTLLLRRQPEL